MGTTEERQQFVTRLTKLVDRLGYSGHGFIKQLAVKYKVTPGASRKWLSGDTMPSYEICLSLCKEGKVSFEWLMTGRGSMEIATYGADEIRLIHATNREIALLSDFRGAVEDSKKALERMASEADKVATGGQDGVVNGNTK